MDATVFGFTEGQIAQFGLTFGVGAFGTFVLFLVLSFGMLGFLAKSLIQWILGM
jgi:hypothetical protein